MKEPRTEFFLECQFGSHHLDGNRALQSRVPGAIDFSHGAGANERGNFVGTQLFTNSELHLSARVYRNFAPGAKACRTKQEPEWKPYAGIV
jgi:hypothetical protein